MPSIPAALNAIEAYCIEHKDERAFTYHAGRILDMIADEEGVYSDFAYPDAAKVDYIRLYCENQGDKFREYAHEILLIIMPGGKGYYV
jgi:hypothetical protein